jgi:hypothetical protein
VVILPLGTEYTVLASGIERSNGRTRRRSRPVKLAKLTQAQREWTCRKAKVKGRKRKAGEGRKRGNKTHKARPPKRAREEEAKTGS